MILTGIVLNLYINLERTDAYTKLSLSVHEHGIYLHPFLFLSAIYNFQHTSPVEVLHLRLHVHLCILISLSNCEFCLPVFIASTQQYN